jgi:hypothetical protein
LAAALGVALAVIVTAGGQNNGSTVRAATVSGYMSGIVTVSWAPVSGAADYALYRDSTRVATAGPSATSTRFSVAAGTHTLSVVAEFAVATTTAPTTTAPAGGCTKTLAAGGDVRTFIQSLSAGQTGCLSPGTYNQSVTLYNGDSHGTTTAPVTLTSADPSNPATIFGRFVTETGADNLTFSYLKFNWNAGQSVAPSVTVGSNNVTFNHDDVTNGNTSICFDLINDATYGVANNTVIENSTVHGCGLIPATNGDHGIYVSGNNDQIHDNWIYNNADRGVQLRGAMGAVVEHNVIDGNGEGVIFGDLNASNNTVAYNTIANSNVRWNAEVSLPGTGNSFHDNCTWATNTNSYYDSAGGVSLPGIAVANNIIGNPGYAGNGNYTLPSGSPCAGDGPSGTPGVGSAPPPPPPTTTTTAPPPLPPTTTAPTTTSAPPPSQSANLFVSPQGSDSNPCTQSAPCASLNGAYQKANAGDVVQIASGTYPNQVIGSRASLRNLSPGCFVASPGQCVHFVGSNVTINGSLEIHGSSVWVDGGSSASSPGISATGYVDTEADSTSVYPDHVVVQGTHSTSFGVFNANTVTFRWMDVGPATVTSGCAIAQGPGMENKIGFGGGITVVPTNITLDGLHIHDQNGDSGRIASGCHFGGLFLVTANGLTVQNTVFEKNVVYNVQIQNFGGAPAPTNVSFANDSFGCPVDWLYNGAGCDGQASIQFDGTFPGVSITGSKFAGGDYGCYAGTCDYSNDVFSGNTSLAPSVSAPPLP